MNTFTTANPKPLSSSDISDAFRLLAEKVARDTEILTFDQTLEVIVQSFKTGDILKYVTSDKQGQKVVYLPGIQYQAEKVKNDRLTEALQLISDYDTEEKSHDYRTRVARNALGVAGYEEVE